MKPKTFYVKIISEGISYEHLISEKLDIAILSEVLNNVLKNAKKVFNIYDTTNLSQQGAEC